MNDPEQDDTARYEHTRDLSSSHKDYESSPNAGPGSPPNLPSPSAHLQRIEWARNEYRLGNTCRYAPGSRQTNLKEAIGHYQNALEVFDRQFFPDDWAKTQEKLTIAMRELVGELEFLLSIVPAPAAPRFIKGVQYAYDASFLFLSRLVVFFTLLVLTAVILPAMALYIYQVYQYNSPNNFTCVPDRITISSSTAMVRLLQAVALDYQGKCQGAKITVNLPNLSNGNTNGIAQVDAGRGVDIGASDIFADATQNNLADHQVAIVLFALVINGNVHGITKLTPQQIKDIYSGTIANWHDVGSQENQGIAIISRPATSGARATFEKYILGGTESISGPESLMTDDNDLVVKYVRETPGAIGYVPLYYAERSGLTILSIDDHAPTPSMVESGKYTFWNIEHMYTRGDPTGLAKAFIDYMYTDTAKSIANQNGYVSISDLEPGVLDNH